MYLNVYNNSIDCSYLPQFYALAFQQKNVVFSSASSILLLWFVGIWECLCVCVQNVVIIRNVYSKSLCQVVGSLWFPQQMNNNEDQAQMYSLIEPILRTIWLEGLTQKSLLLWGNLSMPILLPRLPSAGNKFLKFKKNELSLSDASLYKLSGSLLKYHFATKNFSLSTLVSRTLKDLM
jgi:hypothetical protein